VTAVTDRRVLLGESRARTEREEDSMKTEDMGGRRAESPLLKIIPFLITSALMIAGVAMAAGSVIIPLRPSVTLTGIVSDSVCGDDHGIMAQGDAECTRACVELGAQYTLMVGKVKVGKRMYLLYGHKNDLQELAGMKVTVKGRAVSREAIAVDQVYRSF
jgi:hypothetical protein